MLTHWVLPELKGLSKLERERVLDEARYRHFVSNRGRGALLLPASMLFGFAAGVATSSFLFFGFLHDSPLPLFSAVSSAIAVLVGLTTYRVLILLTLKNQVRKVVQEESTQL